MRFLASLTFFLALVNGWNGWSLGNTCNVPQSNSGLPGGRTYNVSLSSNLPSNISSGFSTAVSKWKAIEDGNSNLPQIDINQSSPDNTIFVYVDSRSNWVDEGAQPDDDAFYWPDGQGNAHIVFFSEASPESWSSGTARFTSAHELGHAHSLGHPSASNCTQTNTVMIESFNPSSNHLSGPSTCDHSASDKEYGEPDPNGGSAGTTSDPGCENEGGQAGGEDNCSEGSPILVSVRGNRLQLTDPGGGVNFDLNADGFAERMAWTAAGADDAFLFLDRNGNGIVDDGAELFGNFTPQPDSATPNGFLALAVYDQVEQGGNGDGKISGADAIFRDLGFWIDLNHDGVSQSHEMRPLSSTRVLAFNLTYRESRRQDQYGNAFRYVSTVLMRRNTPGPRRKFAVDVFFRIQSSTP